jgi:hypothetical protein
MVFGGVVRVRPREVFFLGEVLEEGSPYECRFLPTLFWFDEVARGNLRPNLS